MKIRPISGLLEEIKIPIMILGSIMSAFKNQMERWINIYMLLLAQVLMYYFQITQYPDISGLVVVHNQQTILKLYIQF